MYIEYNVQYVYVYITYCIPIHIKLYVHVYEICSYIQCSTYDTSVKYIYIYICKYTCVNLNSFTAETAILREINFYLC